MLDLGDCLYVLWVCIWCGGGYVHVYMVCGGVYMVWASMQCVCVCVCVCEVCVYMVCGSVCQVCMYVRGVCVHVCTFAGACASGGACAQTDACAGALSLTLYSGKS